MKQPVVLKIFKHGVLSGVKQFEYGQQIVVGASQDAQLCLEGNSSLLHASMSDRDGTYFLQDLGSSEGTYKNGEKVFEAALTHGDKLAFGDYIVEFYIGVPDVAVVKDAVTSHDAKESSIDTNKKPIQEDSSVVTALPKISTEEAPGSDFNDIDEHESKFLESSAPPFEKATEHTEDISNDQESVSSDDGVISPGEVSESVSAIKPVIDQAPPVSLSEDNKSDTTEIKKQSDDLAVDEVIFEQQTTNTTSDEEMSVMPVSEVFVDDESTAIIDQSSPLNAATDTSETPSQGASYGTYAPPSHYKNLTDFVKPSKGGTVEVLIAWKERVLSANHFSKKGTVYYGTHPGNDIVIPSLTSAVSKTALLSINTQADVFIPSDLTGSLVFENSATPLSQVSAAGRIQSSKLGQKLTLAQGEMVRIGLGEGLEVVVRYTNDTPKPAFIPFIDLASNGFLAIVLSVILALAVSLYVTINKEAEKLEEEPEYRTALIIEKDLNRNPPPPPPKPIPQKVKPIPKKVEPPKPKKVVKAKDNPTKKPKGKKTDSKNPGKTKKVAKSSGGNNKPAAGVKRNDKNKDKSRVGSVQQGGSVKTGKKAGAQAKSETKDPNKSAVFTAFGTAGKSKNLNKAYDGKGQLGGMAEGSTGKNGFNEDREGDGLGSKLKATGGGQGKSNVGVLGIDRGGSGKGLGTGGGFGSGIGKKANVTISTAGTGAKYGGNIDRNGIRRVFVRNQSALQSCYERALVVDKGLNGKVMLDFDIGEQGRVVSMGVNRSKSTLYNSTLNNCLVGKVKSWKFPEPPDGMVVNILYPLAFNNN